MAQFEVSGSPTPTAENPEEIEGGQEEHGGEGKGEGEEPEEGGEPQNTPAPSEVAPGVAPPSAASPSAATPDAAAPGAATPSAPALQSQQESHPGGQRESIVEKVLDSLKHEIEEIKQQCQRTELAVQQLTSVKGEIHGVESPKKEVKDEKEQPEKSVELESRLEEIADQISNMQGALSQQIENVQEQANEIENGLGLLVERVNVGAGVSEDMTGLRELFKKIEQIETNMDTIGNTSAKLMQDAADRASELDNIEEKLAILNDTKADREELDEALLDKADKVAIERKVSHELFHNSMADITEALHEAITRINLQENMWHQALNEFQVEVEKKLDKQEMAPLKEFINKKLKNLHKRLKTLAKLRKAEEAAAAKKDLMKDNNCLSCDADAVMRKREELLPFPPAPPPHHNIRPFLTYELDMIRNEKKKIPAKNLVRLEEALSKKQISQPLSKWVLMCNRYCGGGHTVTTPSQRVTHVGRFGTCVPPGPEATQLVRSGGPVPCPAGYGPTGYGPAKPTDVNIRAGNGDARRSSRRAQSQKRGTYSFMQDTVEKMI